MPDPRGGLISSVDPGSLCDQLGLKTGDRLLRINGHPLRDIIDVQFYAADEELELLVERAGHKRTVVSERDYGADLGLEFANPTFDVDVRRCANNCDFCFVKQNPRDMRRSLYVKDDDYRHSFLYGSFVTLTNLSEADWRRLEEQRLSPLYVSVHATDPELRRRFLRRASAPDILEQLHRLATLGIEIHAQVVLVPGLNDGANLARTLADLKALYQRPVASVSLVPIGLTRYHTGTCRTYTQEEARLVLDEVEQWRREHRATEGSTFFHPSDEWYLVAGRPIPEAGEYEDFPQVENGVGMVRLLLDEWERLREDASSLSLKPATLVCGTLIAPILARVVAEINALSNGGLQMAPVANVFFGPLTTVSGLLTGRDVCSALRGRMLGDLVLVPRSMLTGRYAAGSTPPGMTLDDLSLADLRACLGVPAHAAGTLAEALAILSA